MSECTTQQITCPKCGHLQAAVIWSSINTLTDPDLRNDVLDGKIFVHKCINCGEEFTLRYNMLYHDMKNGAMVYLVSQNEVEDTKADIEFTKRNLVDRFAEIIGNSNYSPKFRIVTSPNRLREKAIIFDAGLDDRVVEIAKILCWFEIHKQDNTVKDGDLYFYIADNEYKIQIVSSPITCDMPRELYDTVLNVSQKFLQSIGDHEYVVDHMFGGTALSMLHE